MASLILPGVPDDTDFTEDLMAEEPPEPDPKTINQKSGKKLLERYGYTVTRGGKHVVKMEKEGCRPITLPKHKGAEYGKSLSAEILRQIDRT